ncbi:MAG: hypothetical protein IKG01_14630 [Lachnospiraceae bacterium]|nr:hypothetical protein [Lachnospiraceae bacterium]
MTAFDYSSKRWREKRKHILLRDGWVDQVMLRDGVTIEANTVHHILPREEYPQYEWEDWNLISVNETTHKQRLHEKYTGKLTKYGKRLMFETALKNDIPLKMLTLVIGMPGSGKSTWVKKNLHGGLVYDMDAIACAFRLTVPHKEPTHAGARRMAAALRVGWLQSAREYSNNLFVVRTAPDVKELAETKPDRIVVMTKQYVDKPYRFSREDYQKQIDTVIEWAQDNDVPVEYYPPGS